MLPIRDHLPTRLTPFVNYLLIAANIAVFVWELQLFEKGVDPEALTNTFGLVPARIVTDPGAAFVTVFTSMFMHGSLGHLGGNMLFLWIFGDNVEDAMGHARYLAFYLLAGVIAGVTQSVLALGDPSAGHIPMVGASGAISGVLAAYALLYPRSPITVINPVPLLWLFYGLFLEFPAWLVIALFFVANLWSTLSNTGGGVAFAAHVGGFLGGALLVAPFMAGRERVDEYARWQRWARRRQRGTPPW